MSVCTSTCTEAANSRPAESVHPPGEDLPQPLLHKHTQSLSSNISPILSHLGDYSSSSPSPSGGILADYGGLLASYPEPLPLSSFAFKSQLPGLPLPSNLDTNSFKS